MKRKASDQLEYESSQNQLTEFDLAIRNQDVLKVTEFIEQGKPTECIYSSNQKVHELLITAKAVDDFLDQENTAVSIPEGMYGVFLNRYKSFIINEGFCGSSNVYIHQVMNNDEINSALKGELLFFYGQSQFELLDLCREILIFQFLGSKPPTFSR